MSKKRHLLIIMLLVVCWVLGSATTKRPLAGPPAAAHAASQAGEGQPQWEYCALTKAVYAGSSRGGIYWLVYFGEGGPRVAEIEASVTEGGSGAAMAKAVAQLGAQGWEMVAQGPLETGQGQTSALYFKRLKQATR